MREEVEMSGIMKYSRIAVIVLGVTSVIALETGWRVVNMLSHVDKTRVEMFSEASMDDQSDSEEGETAFC